MPRIKAETVAEHRKAQRDAILAAARAIILADGLGALRFVELAERAKLARPSIYEYFKTKSEVVVALVEEEAPRWRSEVSKAMSSACSPEESLAAFVRAVLQLVQVGRHELAFALADGELDEAARIAISKAHEELFGLVAPALKELGGADGAQAELIGGVIATAGQALRRDRKRKDLIDVAVAFVIAGARTQSSRNSRGDGLGGKMAAKMAAKTRPSLSKR